MAKSKQEVVVVNDQAAMAEYADYQGPTGIEGMNVEDITVPRIKLAQGTSPEVKEGDVKEGDLFINVTGEVLCPAGERLPFIPIISTKEFILWRDQKDNNGGIMARAKPVASQGRTRFKWDKPNTEFTTKLDGKMPVTYKTANYIDEDGLGAWGSQIPGDDDSNPAANAHFNYIVALPDHGNLVLSMSLSRSQVKRAKDFNYMLNMGKAPAFARKFTMESVNETNSQNQTYKNFKFRPNGIIPLTDLGPYKAILDAFSGTDWNVDLSDGQGDTEVSGEDNGKF